MDRSMFDKKTPKSQAARVDRFVLPRSSLPGIRQRWSLINSWKPIAEYPDARHTKYVQRRQMASRIEDIFNIETRNRMSYMDTMMRRGDGEGGWPCVPREKPYLSTADSVLDLPSYKTAPFPELLDWNKDDVLVAALGMKYYKWSWKNQGLVNSGLTRSLVYCCKFDPRGELLALGSVTLEIHHHGRTKRISSNTCKCLVIFGSFCHMTAVDWSPTGNSLVTGCSNGMLCVFTRTAELVNYERPSVHPILHVKVSPDARYVAVSTVANCFVQLLSWPSLHPYFLLDSGWIVKSITWHPWRSALLGIGAVTQHHQSVIALWSIPQAKEIRQTFLKPDNYDLDSMLFSPRTGELVVSMWNSERTPYSEILSGDVGSRLMVLSDPETVVDEWGETKYYLDRVRTMVFSPDGTKLATPTTEEDLIIWNFLPEDKRRVIKKERFCTLPIYVDELSFGLSLR